MNIYEKNDFVSSACYKIIKENQAQNLLDLIKQGLIPCYLYKYKTINQFTHSIIANNEMYFSSPANFNDPYDCNIPIDSTSSDENIRDWILSNGGNEEDVPVFIQHFRNNPDYVPTIIKKHIKANGISCFSKLYDSILMWSHYADYHKGICLKFDITKDPFFFLTPFPVIYSQFLPHYNHFCNGEQQIPQILRTKFAGWGYEQEIRVVKEEDEILGNKNSTNPRIFKFKNEALIEIIFGTNTSEEDIKIIKKLCEKSGKNHVKFSKMKLKEGIYYGLEKVDL